MRSIRSTTLAIAMALGSAALGTATAQAGDVAWSVSIGGPGFVVNAGQPAFGPAWRPAVVPAWRPAHVRPVVVARPGWRGPVVVARPGWRGPVVVARPGWRGPVAVAPAPVFFGPPAVVVPRFVAAPRPLVAAVAWQPAPWVN